MQFELFQIIIMSFNMDYILPTIYELMVCNKNT